MVGFDQSRLEMRGKGKVLIVEDVVLSARFMTALLEKHGMVSEHVESGKEAIVKLQESSYDLVLMELNLSGLNGYETTVYIREILKSTVPILALTSAVSPEEDTKCTQAGITGCLLKPVRGEALLAKMNELGLKPENRDGTAFVDLHFLEKTMRGNREVIAQTMAIFLRYLPENIQDVLDGVEQKNFPAIRMATHKMKSSVSIVGLNQIEQILVEMEKLATSEINMERIEALKNSLVLLCDRAITEINELRKQYE